MNDTYFNNLHNAIISQAEKYTFNLNDLPHVENYLDGIRHIDKFSEMFKSLDSKRNSCLYWFELDDNECCGKLIKSLDKSRGKLKKNVRTVPAQNKNIDSKTLYLGIRQGGYTKKWELSNISGRMIQHLGFYEVGSTQGLQLVHWAGAFDFKITLNVFQFEEGFPSAYLEAIEKIMAYKLRPLCGKH